MIRLFTMACSMLMVAPMLHAREIVVEPDSGDGKPIAAALQQAKPGDVVTLQGGTYREAVKAPAGEPEKPITLRGADGERVIITGMAAIDGWEAGDGGVYTVTVYWKPDQLYVADRPLTKARTPDEGFWIAEGGGDNTLTDAANLRNLKNRPHRRHPAGVGSAGQHVPDRPDLEVRPRGRHDHPRPGREG